ncbi:MAG: hypothetical protein CL537_15460 [Alcanivoracaceae bacterium]|uniref:hypothetical protein n=1 Tax=Alcanivorax sp. MD8A TaxID=1177157 RepID=UPI000C5760BE|nr:hypothetical protein [Alcanivorax sp. MD8A]MAX56885.1 hypothetical protein [Alcanivoracaceae bacterium]MCG8438015.1 hypothetical protein [Pseudomonadales bacterium]PNE01919.1 hypothetical protein A15D_02517 [Alcanivorax sp. MD8A]|tara:strand:+ start:3876 stop:4223 length:348 start_codon:yes stop_codon:yes gene_type:complete
MKKMVGTFAIMATLGLASSPALAWRCDAASPSAWGWGSSSSRSTAVSIALQECAIRTPWGQACYIQRCVNTRSLEGDALDAGGDAGKPEYMGKDDKLDFSSEAHETQGGAMEPAK